MQAVIIERVCPKCGGSLFPPDDDPDMEAECINCGWHKYRHLPPPKEPNKYRTRPSKYAA